jgi:glutathione synthase/RimK-type ligase-like ATP-grasp enzyme
MDDLDVLFLRNDSMEDLQERPWASPVGVVFGQMLKARGVRVANDPTSLHPVPLEIGDVERGMSKKLVADGMYFVGIDVIGDKVVEINAESPGGMQSVERLYEIDVCPNRHRSLGAPHRLEAW